MKKNGHEKDRGREGREGESKPEEERRRERERDVRWATWCGVRGTINAVTSLSARPIARQLHSNLAALGLRVETRPRVPLDFSPTAVRPRSLRRANSRLAPAPASTLSLLATILCEFITENLRISTATHRAQRSTSLSGSTRTEIQPGPPCRTCSSSEEDSSDRSSVDTAG